mmetsp:Transcript_19428/g.34649  ORF Transcript_19428/g.34649 Transcript_19428/m.34649 type:complete len:153 (+) Transcript_19428:3-461(+)
MDIFLMLLFRPRTTSRGTTMEDALVGDRHATGIDTRNPKRPRSQASSASGTVERAMSTVMPLVASFFSQAEARELLSPVSRGVRRAVSRAQVVTPDVGAWDFLHEMASQGARSCEIKRTYHEARKNAKQNFNNSSSSSSSSSSGSSSSSSSS